MFFAIALDTGEGFAIGVRDRSANASMIIFGELETEAGLDQPQDDDEIARFKNRYVIKTDMESSFYMNSDTRARLAHTNFAQVSTSASLQNAVWYSPNIYHSCRIIRAYAQGTCAHRMCSSRQTSLCIV